MTWKIPLSLDGIFLVKTHFSLADHSKSKYRWKRLWDFFLFLKMCVCVHSCSWVWVRLCICHSVFVKVRGQPWMSATAVDHVWDKVSCSRSYVYQASPPTSFQGFSCHLDIGHWDFRHVLLHLALLGSGESNSGTHACVASAFLHWPVSSAKQRDLYSTLSSSLFLM